MAKKKSAKSKQAGESKETETLDFEASLLHVEQIVGKLESGELNLTESLEQYEVGVKRLKQCHQLLEAAEQRVNVLAGFDADGNPVTQPLDEQAPGKPPAAGRSAKRSQEKENDDQDASPGLF